MKKISLVIVDDHKMFLDGITAVLSKQEDMEVLLISETAKQALSFLETEKPDLLITDISMPEMNGLEFIKIAKHKYPTIKILVISMFQQLIYFKGIDGYLLKDSGQITLLETIRKIVIENKKCFYEIENNKNESLDFKHNILTKREKEIIQFIAKEFTTDQISEKLFLSKYTVETHKKNIFTKLQVNNIAGMLHKAMYLGYLD